MDVLYTKGGTTGFAAVNRTESEFNVWVHVAVLKMLPPSVVDPFFVEFALNSPECYAQSQRYTHGVGNQDLGLRRMIKIVLPVPPIGEQREIVRRVEQLFAYADQLEAKVATAKQRIDALTQSLLAKAFRGELVPQDPAAEPASVLLDRIRAQRAATPKPKRGRKAATS
ncbi:type I restriction endonuclease subunit S [Xanthomonas oryzae pv. oryzae]|nr:type I restriction endonuclease subunit S [Xanthomonas oryzae pv. oryzae]UXV99670.1 type I restriction endonuclease subunit S [Xanthomonas oryzae pv. oryzae]